MRKCSTKVRIHFGPSARSTIQEVIGKVFI
jgi:hypothetical protein